MTDDYASLKIAVAGTGYVGLSIAVLLSQHHDVVAVDIVPDKVEMINRRESLHVFCRKVPSSRIFPRCTWVSPRRRP